LFCCGAQLAQIRLNSLPRNIPRIRMAFRSIEAFAGLWETWNSPDGPVESCTICTTDVNDMMGQLHDRMPIILPKQSIDHWLDPSVNDPVELKPMLQQFPGGEMQSWAIGKAVGNVRNQGPTLMDPIEAPHDLKFE